MYMGFFSKTCAQLLNTFPALLQNHVGVGRELAPVSVHPRVKLFLRKALRGLVREVLAVEHVALQERHGSHRHGHQELPGHDPGRDGAQHGRAGHGNGDFVRKAPHLNEVVQRGSNGGARDLPHNRDHRRHRQGGSYSIFVPNG